MRSGIDCGQSGSYRDRPRSVLGRAWIGRRPPLDQGSIHDRSSVDPAGSAPGQPLRDPVSNRIDPLSIPSRLPTGSRARVDPRSIPAQRRIDPDRSRIDPVSPHVDPLPIPDRQPTGCRPRKDSGSIPVDTPVSTRLDPKSTQPSPTTAGCKSPMTSQAAGAMEPCSAAMLTNMCSAQHLSGMQKAADDHRQARKSPGRLSETYKANV